MDRRSRIIGKGKGFHPAFFLLASLLVGFQLWGLDRVPFHPDESTQLYMSADLPLLLSQPSRLAWTSQDKADLRHHYRLLDAPLTRYLLGIGRELAGLPALAADWDWSETWQVNRQAGALPSPNLLRAGRLAITLLLPLSLAFIFLAGRELGGETNGLLAALLLGLNALVLLHGRRAMAEGTLTLGVAFSLWSFIRGDRRPWLAALAVALAFNAKQSTLALFPAGLLAVGWITAPLSTKRVRRSLANMAQYIAVFVLITLALNPFLWKDPWEAAQSAWQARRDLLSRQVADLGALAPERVLETPGERTAALLINLYLAPPSFAEYGNYWAETEAAERTYLTFPGHALLRSLPGGGLFLLLTLFGLVTAIWDVIRKPDGVCLHGLGDMGSRIKHSLAVEQRNEASIIKVRTVILLSTAGAFQFAALALTIPLPYQRYALPLVPFACLWAAHGFRQLSSLNRPPKN